jgi:hypothetical protein
MLSAPIMLRRRGRLQVAALRWLALFSLLFATPVPQQMVSTAASLLEHASGECGDCDDGDCCPAPCQGCDCCAHSCPLTIVRVAIPLLLSAPGEWMAAQRQALHSSEYVSPPFRPPTA